MGETMTNLITDLCAKVVKSFHKRDEFLKEQEHSKIIKTLRKRAFQILIKKSSTAVETSPLSEYTTCIETQLLTVNLQLYLEGNTAAATRLKRCIDKLDVQQYEQVLTVLLCLRGQQTSDLETEYTPFNFEDDGRYSKDVYTKDYPVFDGSVFKLPQSLINMSSKGNPYLPIPRRFSSFVDCELTQLDVNEKSRFFNDALPFSTKPVEKPPCKENAEQTVNKPTQKCPQMSSKQIAWEYVAQDPMKKVNQTWDTAQNVRSVNVGKSTLFESGGDTIHVLWFLHLRRIEPLVGTEMLQPFLDFRPISTKDFINDAIKMLVGVSSLSFKWSEKQQVFGILRGLCVDGVIHSTLTEISQGIVKCATFYNKLYALTKSPEKQIKFGYIFRDVCAKLNNLLQLYRQTVLAINNDESILSFLTRIEGLQRIMETTANCFFITFGNSNKIPAYKGTQLLLHLHEQFIRASEENLMHIVFYFLYHGTQMYLRRFIQPWIFEGLLCDPHSEFFIESTKRLRLEDRSYWINGFRIIDPIKLPPFLNGQAQAILLSGKNVHFLKTCTPNSPVIYFMAEKSITLRLSLTKMRHDELKKRSTEFYERGLCIEGTRISFQSLHDLKIKQDTELMIRATITQNNTINRLKLQLQEAAHLRSIERNERVEEYYEEKKKMEAQRQSFLLIDKLHALNENKKTNQLELEHTALIEDEKEKLLSYYADLSALADKRYQLEDARTVSLNKTLAHLMHLPMQHTEKQNEPIRHTEVPVTLREESVSNHNYTSTITPEEIVENLTTPVNHNLPAFLDTTTTKQYPLCDNVTTPTNNNQVPLLANLPKNQLTEVEQIFLDNQIAAQRNRMKVLTQEMDIGISVRPTYIGSGANRLLDAAVSLSEAEPETELQINRRRIMSRSGTRENEARYAMSTHDLSGRNRSDYESSELQANRNKILSRSHTIPIKPPPLQVIQSTDNCTKTVLEENVSNFVMPVVPTLEAVEKITQEVHIEVIDKLKTATVENIDVDIVKDIIVEPLEEKEDEQICTKIPVDPSLPDISNASVMYKMLRKAAPRPKPRRMFLSEMKGDLPVPPFENRSAFSFQPAYVTNGNEECAVEFDEVTFTYTEIGDDVDDFEITWDEFKDINGYAFDINAKQSLMIPLTTQLQLSNNSVITYFLREKNVLSHFKSLRNYFFFFDYGFQHKLTTSLFEILYVVDYPTEIFSYKVLNEIMVGALAAGVTAQKEAVSIILHDLPSVINLEAVDIFNCISLSYTAEWPLNIIITDNVLEKYNMIFKYLVQLRRVQWVLENIFQELKILAKEPGMDELVLFHSPQYKKLQLMRHIMTSWLVSLQRHVMGVVLHGAWETFNEHLHQVKSIDDIYEVHRHYVHDVVFRCSLNENSKIFMVYIHKAFECIFQYDNLLRCRQWVLKENAEFYTHANFKKLSLCFHNFQESVKYIIKLGEKQVRTGYQPHLDQMVTLLNFNGHYKTDSEM